MGGVSVCAELWALGFGGSVVVGFGEAGVGFSWLGCMKEGGVGVLVVVVGRGAVGLAGLS